MKRLKSFKPQYEMLRLKILIFISYLIVLSEKTLLSFWLLGYWIAFFCALWLFDIIALFGSYSQIAAAILFICGAIILLLHGFKRFKLPHKNEILQRLEKSSALSHQPLLLQQDFPADQNAANPLWQRELKRRKESISRLRPPRIYTDFAKSDPYGLRFIIVLALICGLWVSGTDWNTKLTRGLFPLSITGLPPLHNVSLIVSPPAYTGQKQMVLSDDTEPPPALPEGSIIKVLWNARVTLPFITPVLQIGDQVHSLTTLDHHTFAAEAPLSEGQEITLRQGPLVWARWAYSFTPDTPPSITLDGPPEIIEKGQFQIPLEVKDDYGVRAIKLRIENRHEASLPPFIQPAESVQLVMSPAQTAFKTSPVYDFAWHGLAGQTVRVYISAEDAKGQMTRAEPFDMRLPERQFRAPLAQALNIVRKSLIASPLQDTKPYALHIDSMIHLGLERPVFMGMRAVASRLYYNEPSNDIAASSIALLWRLAVQIEDGALGTAEKNLKNVQARLDNLLQQDNPAPQEIAALMQELRAAMAEYIQEAARAWQEQQQAQGMDMPDIPPEMLGEMMQMSDIGQMMDQIEAELMAGNTQKAQEMLAQMQRLMQMADPSSGQAMPQDVQDMLKSGEDMKALIAAQEALLAKTRKQAELLSMLDEMGAVNEREPPPFIKSREMSAEQKEIKDDLKALMALAAGAFSSVPDNLGLAHDQMEIAQGALNLAKLQSAISAEEQALEHLKNSQQNMQTQTAARLKQMTGIRFSGAPRRYDPLGRPYGDQDGSSPGLGSDVQIPDEAEIRRVQEIVDEIRRRASERARPREELDYFHRLLRRF